MTVLDVNRVRYPAPIEESCTNQLGQRWISSRWGVNRAGRELCATPSPHTTKRQEAARNIYKKTADSSWEEGASPW